MISHKYKCIFIHIPKTGGMAVESFLTERDPDANIRVGNRYHNNWHKYKKYFKKEWDEYFKFSVVRNPWARIVSKYLMYKHGNHVHRERFFQRNDFKDSLDHWRIRCDKPQHSFICKGDDIVVDHVCRFENLAEDFKKVQTQLGIDAQDLPVVNKSRSPYDYKDFYNEGVKAKIGELFSRDIDIFNYKFEDC